MSSGFSDADFSRWRRPVPRHYHEYAGRVGPDPFDNRNTLSLTEAVYRRQIRPFGKTKKSLGKVHLPDGLARELMLWKNASPDPSPDAFIFRNTTGGFLEVGNYRYQIPKPLADKFGIPKLKLPDPAPHHGDLGAEHGVGHSGTPAACEGGHHRKRVHAGTPRERLRDGWLDVLDARKRGEGWFWRFCNKWHQSLETKPPLNYWKDWWAQQDSNLRLPPCEGVLESAGWWF
jgi:hypothetical protein